MKRNRAVLYYICSVVFVGFCSDGKRVDKSNMVNIPAGEFEMGITAEDSKRIIAANPNFADYEWFKSEMPKHEVWIDAFYIDKYEVTNKEFSRFISESGYEPKGNWEKYYSKGLDDYPVIGVTWEDANTYCEWLGKRLPTEAEWEKAAKSGKDYLYPWGNEIEQGHENCQTDGLKPVGSSAPNDYGIYDLGGNAFELCSDWYDKDYYKKSPYKNPQGPVGGEFHVMRGGAWFVNCNFYSQTSRRAHYDESVQSSQNVVGFRCAYSVSK